MNECSDYPCERCESACYRIPDQDAIEYQCSGCYAIYTPADYEHQRKLKREQQEQREIEQCFRETTKRRTKMGGSGDKGPKLGTVIYIPDGYYLDPEQERAFVRRGELKKVVTVPLDTTTEEARAALQQLIPGLTREKGEA